jgi:hypothetical protein
MIGSISAGLMLFISIDLYSTTSVELSALVSLVFPFISGSHISLDGDV